MNSALVTPPLSHSPDSLLAGLCDVSTGLVSPVHFACGFMVSAASSSTCQLAVSVPWGMMDVQEALALSPSSFRLLTGAVRVMPRVMSSAASFPSCFAVGLCPPAFSAFRSPLQPFRLTLPWLSFRLLELFMALSWLYMCMLESTYLIGCTATRALSSLIVGFSSTLGSSDSMLTVLHSCDLWPRLTESKKRAGVAQSSATVLDGQRRLYSPKKRAGVAQSYSTLARSKNSVKRKTHLSRCLRWTKTTEVLVSRINIYIYHGWRYTCIKPPDGPE